MAVVFGGRSAEHEISLLSARFVLESLDRRRFTPVLLGIDKAGRWMVQEEALLLGASRDPRELALDRRQPSVVLAPIPGRALLSPEGAESRARLAVDVAFPVLHGPMGEDGTVQGLFELSGVPYVGSGVLGSAVGMDKDVMKRLLVGAGLPVLPFVAVRRERFERAPQTVLKQALALGLPLFVKPANLGSSVGVTRVKRASELGAAVRHAFEFDDKVVIERGLERPREIEVAVLGGDELVVSVPGEIEVAHRDGFYSYAAKYLDQAGAVTRVPARLDPKQTRRARELAEGAFRVLEAEGLARVDLFLDGRGNFWLNEINTLPGFTEISMFPKLMQASGVPPRELVTRLIELAIARGERRRARRSG